MTQQPVCAYQISSLKKSITRKRKLEKIVGTKSRAELLDLLESHEPYYDDMPEISDLLFGEKEMEEQSTAQLRRTWTQVKKRVHLPVSKLSKIDVLNYLYSTADFLDWDWSDSIDGTVKKRISKACRSSKQPGQTTNVPSGILPKSNRPKRAPTAYQNYMKERLAEMKNNREFRRLNQKEKFKLAAQQYRRHVQRQEDAEHQQAVEAENAAENRERAARSRAILKKTGKVPKKKKRKPLPSQDEAYADAFYKDLVK